jgi:CheY-like chemotaxis protein
MPKEQMHLLFKRFSQITSDLSKRKLGTGLGLFITKELCERMKGEIRAFSQFGKGSAFAFCLPVDPVQEQQSSLLLDKQLVKKLAIKKGLKAMIVDDEPVNHAMLKEFFEMLGVEVVELAENGHVALQKYTNSFTERNCPINIVSMDISMPVMDGKASAQKMREFEVLKGMKPALMMVISGDCSESEMNYCLKADGNIRADAFLKKPANVDEIARALAIYLSKVYEPEEIQRVIEQSERK